MKEITYTFTILSIGTLDFKTLIYHLNLAGLRHYFVGFFPDLCHKMTVLYPWLVVWVWWIKVLNFGALIVKIVMTYVIFDTFQPNYHPPLLKCIFVFREMVTMVMFLIFLSNKFSRPHGLDQQTGQITKHNCDR